MKIVQPDRVNTVILKDALGHIEAYNSVSEAMVTKVDLSHVVAEGFQAFDTDFSGCNFTASKFTGSSWHVVCIDGARCSGMQVTESTLKNVLFRNSKLELVNFRFSKLENIIFEDCALDDVDFNDAKLKSVSFINCSIKKISFSNAVMKNVDLSSSTLETVDGVRGLRGVTVSYDQLMQLAPLMANEMGIKVK